MDQYRELIKGKQRIVVKIGSSSLRHPETGDFDYIKMETLVRELCNIRNQGKDVILVSSGAIAAGKKTVHIPADDENEVAIKQACAAIGQARLMMVYERLFSQYGQVAAQVLLTKDTIAADLNRFNAHNTFIELLKLGVIPIVNENDTISTYEIEFGDNDTLSAIVAALVDADLLILLSDIDGLYSDDPRKNPDARFLPIVPRLTDDIMNMGKESTGSGKPRERQEYWQVYLRLLPDTAAFCSVIWKSLRRLSPPASHWCALSDLWRLSSGMFYSGKSCRRMGMNLTVPKARTKTRTVRGTESRLLTYGENGRIIPCCCLREGRIPLSGKSRTGRFSVPQRGGEERACF